MPAPATYRRLGDRFVAFHQNFLCHFFYLSTVMTQSGHMIAQLAHPTQAASSIQDTGACPLRLRRVFEISSIFLGQAVTHNPQPLHKSSLNVNLAISSSPSLERVLYQKLPLHCQSTPVTLRSRLIYFPPFSEFSASEIQPSEPYAAQSLRLNRHKQAQLRSEAACTYAPTHPNWTKSYTRFVYPPS